MKPKSLMSFYSSNDTYRMGERIALLIKEKQALKEDNTRLLKRSADLEAELKNAYSRIDSLCDGIGGR